jgi:hypothetical protein
MESSDGAIIAETIAAGYTFQGKLLRPALVRLRDSDESRSVLVEKENVGALPEEAGAVQS